MNALKKDISSVKEILTKKSKTMSALKTQDDSLNSKGKGGDKTVSFTNRTNSDLQLPTQHQNWLRLIYAVYERLEPAGAYDTNPRLSYLLQTQLVSSLELGGCEEPRTEFDSHDKSPVVLSHAQSNTTLEILWVSQVL